MVPKGKAHGSGLCASAVCVARRKSTRQNSRVLCWQSLHERGRVTQRVILLARCLMAAAASFARSCCRRVQIVRYSCCECRLSQTREGPSGGSSVASQVNELPSIDRFGMHRSVNSVHHCKHCDSAKSPHVGTTLGEVFCSFRSKQASKQGKQRKSGELGKHLSIRDEQASGAPEPI